ncbi:TonB-dependent receptor domain-containing protein [Parvularcula sp. IMCC14364]|uniref:TonB-dependent receptor domain-containing protein n=1 Tax=Parvularcula sp. IMCC14364 TaxID=3067902 RepID=UPI002740353C|nr:TonB-dependent receptor [Parvularcula sp. IMCC14364]
MKKFNTLAPSALLATAMLVASGAAVAQDDVIIVRGQNIPDEKKATSEISSVLDGEDFIRTGDSDIADALRRVTGLSIEGGKFVIVRGLNSRYSSATLNGSKLPSPEPLKRTAPLDLFPTSVLDGSLVQKTFSPQYSGEFGGGVVELRSKSIPNEDFLEVGVSFSANTETTFASGLFHDGGDADFLGYDDGLRDLPSEVRTFLAQNPGERDLSIPARQSFDQFDTLLISEDSAPLNGSGNIAFGKVFDTDGNYELGTVFYLGYGNEWTTRNGTRVRPETFNQTGGFLDLTEDVTEYVSTAQDITVSALSSTGLEWGLNNELNFTGLVVRKTTKESQISSGVRDQGQDRFLEENTSFTEREILQFQTNGSHVLFSESVFNDGSGIEFDWRAAYGEGRREAPYERQTSFEIVGQNTDFTFSNNDSDNFINFGTIDDTSLSFGADFLIPFDLDGRAFDVIFGAAYDLTERDAQRRDFTFVGSFPQEVLSSRADLIFSDEILGTTGPVVRLQSTAQQPDNFEGLLQVTAAYAGADIELGEYLRAAIGGRYEESKQKTETFATIDPTGTRTLNPLLETDYFLPAVTLTWIPPFTETTDLFGNADIQLRVGYSETITRPQFRELTTVRFDDPETDIPYLGNQFLVNTEIKNYDARLEMYFARGEFATLGFFFKEFEKPIEDFFSTQGDVSVQSFFNAPSAELWGVEFELEKNFDLAELFDTPWAVGKDLVFKTNYTYSDSEVDNTGTVIRSVASPNGIVASEDPANAFISDGSRLVGQSDHLFNLQLGVENNDTGSKATVLANYSSDRILYRGEGSLPEITEEPPITIDLVINQDLALFGSDYNLGVKVQNIFNDDYNAVRETLNSTVSDVDFEQYELGRTFSVSLKREF